MRALACLPLQFGMEGVQRLADDVAHGHARVERGQRVLKDHLHVAAVGAHAGLRQAGQVLAQPRHRSAGRLDQLQHGAAERGLAAAGLADDAQGFPRKQVEADAIDGAKGVGSPEQAARDREGDADVAHRQEGS